MRLLDSGEVEATESEWAILADHILKGTDSPWDKLVEGRPMRIVPDERAAGSPRDIRERRQPKCRVIE